MINLCGFISEVEQKAKKNLSDPTTMPDCIKILFMLNKLPKSTSARSKYIKLLQSLQGEKSGLCKHGVSEAAQILSVLNLLDAKFEFPPSAVLEYKDARKLDEYSNSLPWMQLPDKAAKDFCSVFALLYLSDSLTYEEYDYFITNSLFNYTDADTGFIRSGFIDYHQTEPMRYLKGFFIYMMILEYTHSALRYPARTIDSCIQCYDRGCFEKFNLDNAYDGLVWTYSVSRTMRRTGYRYEDCKKRLLEFEQKFANFIAEMPSNKPGMRAALILLCIAAELQEALPGTIRTEHPLNNVLNKITFF